MSASARFLVLVFAIILTLGSTAEAGDNKNPRTDLYGDPLPRGAVARLGSVRFRFSDLSYTARALAFSADGKKLLAGDNYGGPIIWDSITGERIRKFDRGRFGSSKVVGFTPDGKVFVLAQESSVQEALFFRPESDSERMQLPSLGVNVVPLAVSPDGKRLLFWRVTEVVLWDFAEQKRIKTFPIGDLSKSPLQPLLPSATAALSPDSQIIAYLDSKTDVIHLMDLRTQKTIREWHGAPSLNRGRCLAFSWDGKSLIAGGEFGIRVWDVASGKELRHFAEKGPFSSALAVSPNGKTVAAANEREKVIVLWDMATGRSKRPAGEAPGPLTDLHYTDSKTLISVANGKVVRVWDTVSGKCLRSLMLDQSLGRIAAVSSKGEWLADITESNLVGVWDIAAGKRRWQSTTPLDGVERLTFTPDGKMLLGVVIRSGFPQIVCWDAATGAATSPPRVSRDFLSPDGVILAVGNRHHPREAPVRLFRIGSDNKWRPRGATIRLPRETVNHKLSPDGRTLLVFSKQRSGREPIRLGLIDTVSGGFAGWLLSANEVEEVSFKHAVFSPDSTMVAASYADGSVRLWDVLTRAEVERFTADEGKSQRIAFSPDGRTIASELFDHTVLIWQTRPPMDLDRLWEDLAGADVEAAQRAIAKLTASPPQSVPYLAKRLPPSPRGDARRLRQLIADLDSEMFAVRQKAHRELEKEGEGAEDTLQEALASKPSLELRRRALELLDKLENARRDSSPDDSRVLRAVQVLETIGTDEARHVLKKWSEGASGALRTREARTAMRRLEKQTAK